MFSFQWRNCVHLSRQQIMAIVLLVAAVIALLPIPVIFSPGKVSKDRSRPFPCQDRPCGCRSAEHCKKKCCCFSAEQKLAWAKRYGIDPSEVVAQARAAEPVAKRKSCCASARTLKSDAKPKTAFPNSATKAAVRFQVVIGAMAQECQGVAQTVSGQFVFVIPPSLTLNLLVEPTGERVTLDGARFLLPLAEPPVPPPRLILA